MDEITIEVRNWSAVLAKKLSHIELALVHSRVNSDSYGGMSLVQPDQPRSTLIVLRRLRRPDELHDLAIETARRKGVRLVLVKQHPVGGPKMIYDNTSGKK